MGYSDPSGRDLLGNRSLCFIFICAFGLVTLLQQILYGKNYIKSGQQFSRLKGDETANWTRPVNFSDDGSQKPARNGKKRCFRQNFQRQTDSLSSVIIAPCLADIQKKKKHAQRYLELYDGPYEYNSTTCKDFRQEIIDVKVLTMVKTSELFDRWRNLQLCKWEQNKEETEAFKTSLSRCCNAPSFLFTTKRNTPAGTNLRYEVDTSGILHISTEIFKMFPDVSPERNSSSPTCAYHDGLLTKLFFVFHFLIRCNIPPISEKYVEDVGYKTDIVTINPSIITERFQKLEKWRKPFYEVLQTYSNSSVVLPAFYNTRNTDVSFRVKYMLDDFDSQKGVFFFHPQYLLNVQRFWSVQGIRAKRLSSGLMLVTAAMELCDEVHLYGFWAFPMNPAGIFITHHYYDNVKPRPGFHAMPHEIFNFLHLHSRGILQVHTGPCR
ncbi:alpha-2,8-sialyltransferase 8E isoform X1 [Arapaima gigas]